MITKQYTIRDIEFWKIVLSLGLASIFIFAAFYSFQPLLPILTEEFSISISTASLSMSLSTISLICGLIVFGFLSDRSGRVLFIKYSIFISIIPFIFMLLCQSYWAIILLRFIQGFMFAGVPASALAYIGEEIDGKSSHIATSLYISCNALGGMFGRILTSFLAEQYGWKNAILIIVIFGFVVFFISLLALPKSLHFQPSNASFIEDIKGFCYHLKNPVLLLFFGLGILLQFMFTGVWTYLPFYLTEPPFSMSLQSISYTYFAYSFGIIGAPIAGWLSNRFSLGRVRTMAIFILLSGVLLTATSSMIIVLIGLCIICFGFFTAHSLTASSISRNATYLKGSASSLYLVSYYIGVASGSTLVSPIWNAWKWNGVVIITTTLLCSYLFFLNFFLKRLKL